MTLKPSAEADSPLEWTKSSYSSNEHGSDCVEVAWTKSSYSTNDGPECVEVAWGKSSYSTNDGADCVEVGATPGTIHIRDSKDPDGPHLTFTPESWTAFLGFASAL